MQPNRVAGKDALFKVDLFDDQGERVSGTSATWELRDARGETITAGDVADFDDSLTYVEFEVGADDLQNAGTSPIGHELVVFVTTGAGQAEVRDYFVLMPVEPLACMVNTIITYAEAMATRQTFGASLSAWDASTKADRIGALSQAYRRLARLSYRIDYTNPEGAKAYAGYGTGTDDIWDMRRRVSIARLTAAEFDALPDAFRSALARAQLLEANEVMKTKTVELDRLSGIVSETIGESSVFYGNRPVLKLPICREAMEELGSFVFFTIKALRG